MSRHARNLGAQRNHPGIVFRDGPCGRRAGLPSGPDVWQVVGVLHRSGKKGEKALRYTAKWFNIEPQMVRTAIGYYAAHTEEIDDWIRRNDEEAEAAEAAWVARCRASLSR
jgi:hypothetical protein